MEKNKFVVVISAIILLTAFWIYWVSANPSGTESTLVKYLTISELYADTNHGRVKLGGVVADGSIEISESDLLDATFQLMQDSSYLPVHYYGTRPDLFMDGADVIVEGVMGDGIFEAEILQTKCASRYEGDLRDENAYSTEEM